ncbi:hypothetical protein AWJ20_374 [Sugiyamaella lignohabitans]|uniref:Uncharacterized protein n=1 Tax=Sugiyamaella lignohabitans TaxID=796027 RepID=A0A167CUZ7_9ASCO|nr:uncharacterized protein AWJ20_374 [Sugiyamaella lignohabitans]ANB12136.1 hypothetical protein AWJ20_374 [Sugiyamaella lignohabitans]
MKSFSETSPTTRKKLIALVAAFFASLACGTNYVYSTYSTQLADRIGMTATQSSILGMAGQIGLSLFGPVTGLIIDRYPPMFPIVMGGIFISTGYRTMYTSYVDANDNFTLLVLAYGLAGLGNTLVFNTSVRTSAINWPNRRGTATSLPMSAFGLSALFFSSVAGIIFPGDTQGFLELLSMLTGGLVLLCFPFIRVHRKRKPPAAATVSRGRHGYTEIGDGHGSTGHGGEDDGPSHFSIAQPSSPIQSDEDDDEFDDGYVDESIIEGDEESQGRELQEEYRHSSESTVGKDGVLTSTNQSTSLLSDDSLSGNSTDYASHRNSDVDGAGTTTASDAGTKNGAASSSAGSTTAHVHGHYHTHEQPGRIPGSPAIPPHVFSSDLRPTTSPFNRSSSPNFGSRLRPTNSSQTAFSTNIFPTVSSTSRIHHHGHGKHPHQDVGIKLLFRRDFWEYFFLLGFVSGVGQMYIYSCGYCVRALVHYSNPEFSPGKVQSLQALQVALISSMNFLGRITSGSASDWLVHKLNVQRLWVLVVALTIGLFGHILAIYLTNPMLMWIVSLSIGLSYGLVFGVYPSIVSESFGLKHFSQNWGYVASSPVFSSYFLNLMFGKIFDANSSTKVEGSAAHICLKGPGCYSLAFTITSCVSVVGIALALFMIYTRKDSKPHELGEEEHF